MPDFRRSWTKRFARPGIECQTFEDGQEGFDLLLLINEDTDQTCYELREA
jgi:hypothetical protein